MRKEIIKKCSVSLVLVTLLTGCSNALYFYETEKISLTVEARPDSSQPVQGSLGIKQRVALVAPRVDKKGGEALSSISSFSFKIIPEAGTIFNPVLIQTAFITGEAAANLNQTQATKAAQAITHGVKTETSDELADSYVKGMNDTDRTTFKQITGQDFEKLSVQDYQNIVRIIKLDKDLYSYDLHTSLQKKLAN